ncbi:NUDIX domain-containing protein [Streptomyces sp. YS-B37]|uniref:NUDIX domain-containing protein n=1 Tax=Streptomyces sp. YS-B37 TaxID=3407669 RepID=UPI003B50AA7A
MRTRVIVSALVRDRNNYLFIRQDKPGGAYPGTLHLPGGGVEEGETPEEAVRREVREEVGVGIENLTPFDFDWDETEYKGGRIRFVFLRFTGDLGYGTPTAGSDAAEIIWVPEEEIHLHPHNDPSVRMFSRLREAGYFAGSDRLPSTA